MTVDVEIATDCAVYIVDDDRAREIRSPHSSARSAIRWRRSNRPRPSWHVTTPLRVDW